MTEYAHIRPNYLARFLVLLGIFFVFMPLLAYVSAIICGVIFNIHAMEIISNEHIGKGGVYLEAAKWYQLGSSIGAFIVTSVVFLLSYRERPLDYLRMNRPLKVPVIAKVVILTFCLIVIDSALLYFNKYVMLGNGSVAKWASETENHVDVIMKKLMDMHNTRDLLFNLLLVGLIPAVGEEIFFRGTLQNLLKDWSGNKHLAVIITSVLFALIHQKFTQMLPIFAASLAIGYLYVYTRNLWYNIIIHFINNSLIVLLSYYGKGNATIDSLLNDTYMPNIFLVLVAVGLAGWLFYSIYKNRVIEVTPVSHNDNSDHLIP